MRTRRDWMRWGALAILSAVTSQHVGAAPNCEDLTRPGLFPNTIVQTAVAVPADATTGTPAFCEVTAQISPVAGSKITAVFRLPDNWNGRMLGLGGGGFAGILDLRAPPFVTGPSRAADAGLPRGYATAQTDGGHPSPSRIDTSWIPNNPVAVTDFSHRAVHEMTVLGKGVIASYYGRPATKSYFQGCSTGGRMGLMEAQRYPDDYDGVVAGAPVHSLLTQSSTVVRDQIFKAPGAAVPVEQIKLVHEAVLSACDATDGLKDGVITDPRRCAWKPESLACKAGEAGGSCLTPPQVDALNAVYRTVRTPSGVVGNYGLTRGSEMGWNPIVMPTTPAGPRNFLNGNLGDLVPLMFGDSDFDHAKFDVQKQQEAIHRTPFAKEYEATSTDLRGFLRRGGKLLLWHGLDDVTTSPFGTIDYYESAVKANGGSDIRLFTLPGVDHCGGGLGANTFDPLAALEEWVEKGVEPNSMVAKSRAGGFERPVCAWPKLPYYRSGDPSKADSFVCR